MGGETDLAILLRTLDPLVRPGADVFVTEPPAGTPPEVEVEATSSPASTSTTRRVRPRGGRRLEPR